MPILVPIIRINLVLWIPSCRVSMAANGLLIPKPLLTTTISKMKSHNPTINPLTNVGHWKIPKSYDGV